MKFENNLFCINYNDDDKEYIMDLIDSINTDIKRIMNFFEINEFKEKKTVNIWNDLSDYKNYITPYVGEYHEWMVADTFNCNINILSFDLFLSGSHRNCDFEDYKKILIHEFVHSCQQEVNSKAKNVIWFWEALATNLSNQQKKITEIPYSKSDIIGNYHKLKDAYSVSYTIGQYLLKNYSKSHILEYVKNPAILLDDTDVILERTNDWVKSEKSKDIYYF
jgi:hypothetical protein